MTSVYTVVLHEELVLLHDCVVPLRCCGCMIPSGDEQNIQKVWVAGKLRCRRRRNSRMKLGELHEVSTL